METPEPPSNERAYIDLKSLSTDEVLQERKIIEEKQKRFEEGAMAADPADAAPAVSEHEGVVALELMRELIRRALLGDAAANAAVDERVAGANGTTGSQREALLRGVLEHE